MSKLAEGDYIIVLRAVDDPLKRTAEQRLRIGLKGLLRSLHLRCVDLEQVTQPGESSQRRVFSVEFDKRG